MMNSKQQIQRQAVLTEAHGNYNTKLNAHAFFKTNDHSIGEGLVQDTFIKTWKYLVKGGKIDVMKAFLYHILNQLIIDHYRKHTTESLDGLQESGFDPGTDPRDKLFNMLDGKKALFLISRLPEKYFQCQITLNYY